MNDSVTGGQCMFSSGNEMRQVHRRARERVADRLQRAENDLVIDNEAARADMRRFKRVEAIKLALWFVGSVGALIVVLLLLGLFLK